MDFLCCNRSKLSVEIDLKSEQGRETVKALAGRADVLVENFRLGALDAYGLGYEQLSELNPGLIYCSISGYGRTAWAGEALGHDFTIQAESGLMSITGEPDGSPMKVGVAITDILTGMNATQAILAALIARDRDGEGQHVDTSPFDTAVSVMATSPRDISLPDETASATAMPTRPSFPTSSSTPPTGPSLSPSATICSSARSVST